MRQTIFNSQTTCTTQFPHVYLSRAKRGGIKLSTFSKATLVIVALSALLTGISGCGNKASSQDTQNNKLTLRIGYGKGGALQIVKQQGKLEKRLAAKGIALQWVNFPMGPQMMEAIGAGSLDLGSSASTPPIFAQAAGVNFVYVASIPPGRSSGAILLPKDSPIRSIRDLKGKRIAFQPGSVWQYCLAKLLEQNGLKYEDIKPAKMPPADASSAFTGGKIDAWVQGEPYVTLAQRNNGARILVDTSKIGNTAGFFLGAKETVKNHPDVIKIALEEVQNAGRWALAHPHEAAVMTAERVGLDVPTVERMIKRGTNTHFNPIDESVVKRQQDQADLFSSIKILPKKIDVREVVLSKEEYAQLIPDPGPETERERLARQP